MQWREGSYWTAYADATTWLFNMVFRACRCRVRVPSGWMFHPIILLAGPRIYVRYRSAAGIRKPKALDGLGG
jgi:hypothetical protein